MTRRRRIVLTLLQLGVVGTAMSPAAGAATPLLSGYGGPGSGEQVILGSHVVNRPGAHNGSTTARTSPTAEAQVAPSSTSAGTETTSGAGPAATAGSPHGSHTAPSTVARPRRAQPVIADAPAGAQAGPALSNNDLLMAAIVLCALAGVAVLTRRMARLER